MKLTVIRNGLHLSTGEAKIGQVIEIDGDTIPSLYKGKVRIADDHESSSLIDEERAELEELRVFKAQIEAKEVEVATPEEGEEKRGRGRPRKAE